MTIRDDFANERFEVTKDSPAKDWENLGQRSDAFFLARKHLTVGSACIIVMARPVATTQAKQVVKEKITSTMPSAST